MKSEFQQNFSLTLKSPKKVDELGFIRGKVNDFNHFRNVSVMFIYIFQTLTDMLFAYNCK